MHRPWPLLVFLGAVLAGPAAAAQERGVLPGHRIRVDVRGPLALVEVERALIFGPEVGRAASDEVVVDLDLPDDSRLVDVTVQPPPAAGRPLPLKPGTTDGYSAAMKGSLWSRARVPIDEGADFRLRVAASGLGHGAAAEGWSLRYRFVAPLACEVSDGEATLVLRMPGSLDPAPRPADVGVRVATGSAQARVRELRIGALVRAAGGGAQASARGEVPTVAPWEIGLRLAKLRGRADRAGVLLAAGGPAPDRRRALAVQLCRPPAAADAAPAAAPARLTLLLDRSRSVGPEGASVSRDLAKAIVEALPPSVDFNVVLFDRASEPLFKLPRAATLEALRELDNAVDVASLRNGTRPAPALRKAIELDARDTRRGLRYWVMITDGALPDDQTTEALAAAVRPASRQDVEAAVIILRGAEDQRPYAGAEQALAAIPGHLGGVLRRLSPVGAMEAVPAIVRALKEGGDFIDPRVVEPAGLQRQPFDRPAVAPGAGARLVTRTRSSPGRVVVRAHVGGAAQSFAATPVAIESAWMAAVAPAPSLPPTAWEAITPKLAVRLAPVTPAADRTARGQMDKDVVHKTLGYAFLPRARACYLTRAVKSAADFRLKGRVRLELQLERGEMMDALVKSSTLGRPDIEACLRDAAFTLEVPRAMYNDAPVVAALNLVFRPRTEVSRPDASGLSAEIDKTIDKILGPMPLGSDPLELLLEP